MLQQKLFRTMFNKKLGPATGVGFDVAVERLLLFAAVPCGASD